MNLSHSDCRSTPSTQRPDPVLPLPITPGRHPDWVLRDGPVRMPNGAPRRTALIYKGHLAEHGLPLSLQPHPSHLPQGLARPVYIHVWEAEPSGGGLLHNTHQFEQIYIQHEVCHPAERIYRPSMRPTKVAVGSVRVGPVGRGETPKNRQLTSLSTD